MGSGNPFLPKSSSNVAHCPSLSFNNFVGFKGRKPSSIFPLTPSVIAVNALPFAILCLLCSFLRLSLELQKGGNGHTGLTDTVAMGTTSRSGVPVPLQGLPVWIGAILGCQLLRQRHVPGRASWCREGVCGLGAIQPWEN